jgi:hypothetical protein
MKTYYPNVVFAGYTCRVQFGRYRPSGNIAMQLFDLVSGEPIATPTTNLADMVLEPGHVLIKDCDENVGMISALIKAGYLEKIVRPRPIDYEGFNNVAVLNLTPEALTLLQESKAP